MAETMSEKVDAYVRQLVPLARSLKQKEWQWGQFTRPDGAPIETVDHVCEAQEYSARQSEVAELWGINYGPDTPVVCFTGNGPCSKDHAQYFAAVQPSHLIWLLDELGERIERLTRERDEAKSASPALYEALKKLSSMRWREGLVAEDVLSEIERVARPALSSASPTSLKD